MFLIVCCHTPSYDKHAERLRRSLDAVAVPHRIDRVDDEGSWERNCNTKAVYCRMVYTATRSHIVWVDADAVVRSCPHKFYEYNRLGVDFAARMDATPSHEFNRLNSGTLYFGRGKCAEQLLDEWVRLSRLKPDVWDQVHLWHALKAVRTENKHMKVERMPEPYCRVFDRPLTDEPAVIEHFQASRAMKKLAVRE